MWRKCDDHCLCFLSDDPGLCLLCSDPRHVMFCPSYPCCIAGVSSSVAVAKSRWVMVHADSTVPMNQVVGNSVFLEYSLSKIKHEAPELCIPLSECVSRMDNERKMQGSVTQ